MKKILSAVLLTSSLLFIYYMNMQKDTRSPCHVVLKYEDFGIPALSSPLLGRAWWQWFPAYEDREAKFDIKVVVYTQTEDLEIIKKHYPIIEEKNQDYRYVTYANAMQYLKKIETDDKAYFKGCRAANCLELAFFDHLHKQLKALNANHCKKK